MTTKYLRETLCMVLMLAGFMHTDVFAQTIHYQTETKSKFHMLGNLSGLVGNKPIVSDVYMSKDYMLDTNKDDATLFSVADEKITFMNRKKKTYYEMTFDDMASYLSSIQQDVQEDLDQAEQDIPEVEFDFSVVDKGESMNISGHSADRKLMQIEMKYTAEQTNEDGQTETASGKFYTLVDMWVSKDVPGSEVMKEYSERYAESLGEAFGSAGNSALTGLAQVMQQDPRMGPAMEKVQEEMLKVDGITLKSNTYFVLVPESMELDLNAVMMAREQTKEAKKEKRKRGLGNLARGALRGQGINIGEEESSSDTGEIEKQQVLVEMATVYTVFEEVSDDSDRFKVPSKYKKVARPGY